MNGKWAHQLVTKPRLTWQVVCPHMQVTHSARWVVKDLENLIVHTQQSISEVLRQLSVKKYKKEATSLAKNSLLLLCTLIVMQSKKAGFY